MVSLSNTGEPLYLSNRSGNSTSSKNASHYLDKAANLCRAGGFKKIRFRGDTDFSQTKYLDGWDDEGITFVFGINAMGNLVKIAENLPETAYTELIRRLKYAVKTEPRRKPVNVKKQIVKERGYKNIRLQSEQTAEFEYQPVKCRNFFIMLPCQIVKTSRRLVYRLLGWNEYYDIFFRAVETFRGPLRC
ncbi:MAG: hypothetical protein DRP66_06385 [Planctomycetota bacterium]|nr:MAG: hypothetical protein DRP66_06385 [Planctomycetota bacterium]